MEASLLFVLSNCLGALVLEGGKTMGSSEVWCLPLLSASLEMFWRRDYVLLFEDRVAMASA